MNVILPGFIPRFKCVSNSHKNILDVIDEKIKIYRILNEKANPNVIFLVVGIFALLDFIIIKQHKENKISKKFLNTVVFVSFCKIFSLLFFNYYYLSLEIILFSLLFILKIIIEKINTKTLKTFLQYDENFNLTQYIFVQQMSADLVLFYYLFFMINIGILGLIEKRIIIVTLVIFLIFFMFFLSNNNIILSVAFSTISMVICIMRKLNMGLSYIIWGIFLLMLFVIGLKILNFINKSTEVIDSSKKMIDEITNKIPIITSEISETIKNSVNQVTTEANNLLKKLNKIGIKSSEEIATITKSINEILRKFTNEATKLGNNGDKITNATVDAIKSIKKVSENVERITSNPESVAKVLSGALVGYENREKI